MRTKSFALAVCSLLLVLSVQAQEFWDKKPAANWSAAECKRLLGDSPWARTYELTTVSMQPLGMETDRRDDNIRKTTYTVQIRSAKPIREAMIQRAKLSLKYDQLPAEKKQATDAYAAQFLAQQFPDNIVVGVEYSASTADFDRDMATYWQQQTIQTIKNSTHLIIRGKHIEPTQIFVEPGAAREFELIFPRTVSGEPTIGTQDKSFTIEFATPAVGPQPTTAVHSSRGTTGGETTFLAAGRAVLEFKVKKMSAPSGDLIF